MSPLAPLPSPRHRAHNYRRDDTNGIDHHPGYPLPRCSIPLYGPGAIIPIRRAVITPWYYIPMLHRYIHVPPQNAVSLSPAWQRDGELEIGPCRDALLARSVHFRAPREESRISPGVQFIPTRSMLLSISRCIYIPKSTCNDVTGNAGKSHHEQNNSSRFSRRRQRAIYIYGTKPHRIYFRAVWYHFV